MARLYATHRVFTGRPVSRGYVMDRLTGQVVWACPHRHRYRHARRAQECAEKQLRRMMRGENQARVASITPTEGA